MQGMSNSARNYLLRVLRAAGNNRRETMNRRSFLNGTALAAICLIGLSAPGLSRAQQPPPQGVGGAPFIFGNGPLNALRDPAHGSLMSLLDRNDVKNEIGIDARQRDALNDLKQKSRAEMMDKIRTDVQNMRDKMKDMSPEERRAQIQKMQGDRQDAFSAYQSDLDKRVEAILRPSQVKRLHELDLQWRGPLAMVDPSLSDKVGLDPEQHAKVNQLYQEYRNAQGKAFQNAFAGIGRGRRPNQAQGNGDPQNNQNQDAAQNAPQDNGPPPAPPSREEIQRRLQNVQVEMEKTRASIGQKVLALLGPEQMQNWRTLQGRPFTFNTND
jgi:hypothetical protein